MSHLSADIPEPSTFLFCFEGKGRAWRSQEARGERGDIIFLLILFACFYCCFEAESLLCSCGCLSTHHIHQNFLSELKSYSIYVLNSMLNKMLVLKQFHDQELLRNKTDNVKGFSDVTMSKRRVIHPLGKESWSCKTMSN